MAPQKFSPARQIAGGRSEVFPPLPRRLAVCCGGSAGKRGGGKSSTIREMGNHPDNAVGSGTGKGLLMNTLTELNPSAKSQGPAARRVTRRMEGGTPISPRPLPLRIAVYAPPGGSAAELPGVI